MRILVATALLAVSVPFVGAPASADPGPTTTLGGYDASAEAAVVRVAIHEPGLPIPSDPQLDASIGYARSTTATGPISRALSSYVWPGDAVGDGLGTLLGNEKLGYPIKVSSKFPASTDGPAVNAAQITSGNGMSTSADGSRTLSTVVGLGIGNGLSGLGQGLCQLLSACGGTPLPKVDLPDPLAAVATMENLKSQSLVVLGEKSVTASARTTVSGLKILGGIISIDTVDMSSSVTTDGAKAVPSGTSKFVGLKILGQPVDLGDPINIAGTQTPIPKVPVDLSALGIKISYLDVAKAQDTATGSLAAQGLTITVDASALGKLLGGDLLSNALSPILDQIPQAGPLLASLLKLGTKITITVGDVRTKVSAVPAYDGGTGVTPTTTTTSTDPPAVAGDGTPGGVGDLGTTIPGAPQLPAVVTPQTNDTVTPAQSPFQLPGLSQFPSALLLGVLALAGLFGWLFRGAGAWMLAGGTCPDGHNIGVPDLRKV